MSSVLCSTPNMIWPCWPAPIMDASPRGCPVFHQWQARVARLFGVHWNTVASAVRQAVDYGLAHRKWGEILYIGIDEISRRKGHVYVTNVYDLKEKRLLWSGEGRSQKTLRAFFEEHGNALKQRVKAVCCDMWQPYIDMVTEYLPEPKGLHRFL